MNPQAPDDHHNETSKASSSGPTDLHAQSSEATYALIRSILRETALNSYGKSDSQKDLIHFAARSRRVVTRDVTKNSRIFIREGKVIGGMDTMATTLVSAEGKRAARSKGLAKECFEVAGVPTPRGSAFSPDQFEAAQAFQRDLGALAAVKPDTAGAGRGVSLGVLDDGSFGQAWRTAMDARPMTALSSPKIMVEQYVPGLDLRAYVVGESVVGALLRIPAFVFGDGESTLQSLVDSFLERIDSHAFFKSSSSDVVRAFMMSSTEERESVTVADRVYDLSGTFNPHSGGLTVDVTHRLNPRLKELAVDALWALPGVRAGGVDLRIEGLDDAEGAQVLEANENANIALHRYPAFGKPRYIGQAIVDQMIRSGR